MTMSTIDYGILATYLGFVLCLGLWFARKDDNSNEEDYFVAGRSLGWFAVGASLFASNISSEHIIGLATDGFRTGLAVGNYEWGACVILLILGAIFVPFYLGAKIQTMPEFLEKRFGKGAKFYLSIVTIIANILVRISVALFAAGLVFENLFGVNMWVGIIVLAIFTVIYTIYGGLKAVVYTDALQAVILLLGTALVSYIALDKVGGWESLKLAVQASDFDLVRPASDKEMPWVGLVLGVPILGIWYWCTDQVIVQRVLGAKSIHDARMGCVFASLLKILPVFLFVLPGLCARVLFPETDAKDIYPVMFNNLMPIGVKGIVAAALIAALMSSIDSTLNSTGALVSLDIYKHFKPNASNEQLIRVGRIVTLVVCAFGVAWVKVVMNAESLFQYLQQVNAAIAPPIAMTFLVGVFWKRANHAGALSCLIGGLIVGILFLTFPPASFLVSAGINFAISGFILVLVSLMTSAPSEEQTNGLVWSQVSGIVEAETTSGQRTAFRVMACSILVLMSVLWYSFS